MVRKFQYTSIIEVNQEQGPITSLDMALEHADENSVIRLPQGVYTLEKAIKKPGLTIEQRDKDTQVIIIGSERAVVNVMLGKGEVVNFKRITFAHSGLKLQEKYIEARQDVHFR